MVRLTEFRSFLQQKSARNLAKLINKTSLGTIQERQLMRGRLGSAKKIQNANF